MPDLSHIDVPGHLLAGHLSPCATVILESTTTWAGTTEELLAPILKAASGLAGLPIRDPGNARDQSVDAWARHRI